MELLMLLAADYASVDASGKLNILGAFRTIYAQQFPARHELMHLVVKLQLVTSLPRHNRVAVYVVRQAVRMIERLTELRRAEEGSKDE